MLLMYADGYLTLDELACEVYVSINTAAGYVREMRRTLERFGLSLAVKANLGYLVTGSELDKRRCLFEMLRTVPDSQAAARLGLAPRTWEAIIAAIDRFRDEHDIRMFNCSLRTVNIQTALAVARVKNGFPLDASTSQSEKSQFGGLEEFFDDLERAVGVRLGPPDRNYIAMHVFARSGTMLEAGAHAALARDIVRDILACVFDFYRIDLAGDRALVEGMGRHMESIISAKQLGMSQENPLLNTIKTRYILLWEMARTSVAVALAERPFSLTEEEIGYIALYLGSALERREAARAGKRCRIAVLTGNGAAEGTLLSAMLENNIGEEVQIAGIYPLNEAGSLDPRAADLAVATGAVPDSCPLPVVNICLPPRPGDWDAVRDFIRPGTKGVRQRIERYFEEGLFRRLRVSSKREALEELCDLVEGSGIAGAAFRDGVFERERRVSSALNGAVALPHPLVACCAVSKIAVGILEEPVAWDAERSVSIVLLLCLSEDNGDTASLFDALVPVMNDEGLLERLQQVSNLADFLELVCASAEVWEVV